MSTVYLLSYLPESCGQAPASDKRETLLRSAEQCVSILHEFGKVSRDFFPAGLENAVNMNRVQGRWPPPSVYSWRVAMLPFMEEAPLYARIQNATDEFRNPQHVSEDAILANVTLKPILSNVPKLFILESKPAKKGMIAFRRIKHNKYTERLILIESEIATPWLLSMDDIEYTDDIKYNSYRGAYNNGFFALCGDGEVRFIDYKLSSAQKNDALLAGNGVMKLRANMSNELRQDIINALRLE